MKSVRYAFLIFTLLFIVFSLTADGPSYKIAAKAKLVMEDTYGKTWWDNLKDRGSKLYLQPEYDNDFRDVLRFITLPGLQKTEIAVPLETFFKAHSDLLVDGKLYSTLKNGKERKNYWIEDCFYYDSANRQAGIRVLNYYLKTGGSIKRTFYVHWDLNTNTITGAVQLMEYERKITKGEYQYTAESVEPVGYNPEQKKLYYLNMKDFIKVVKDGKYNKYLRSGNLACEFFSIDETAVPRKIVSMEIGSIDTTGVYSAALNMYFFPGYKDLADKIDKKSPEGFLVDLNTGSYKKITVQPHQYWADFDPATKTLYHISSSTGQLIATDITTGRQKGTLRLGDAGDDRYHKFCITDDTTALYYLQGKLIAIDLGTLKVKNTVNLAGQHREFSASSPAYILPEKSGIVIEARTEHNKTTGYLYLLK